VTGFYVGGEDNKWEFFVAGPPIQQMAETSEEAKSGEVVLSREAQALIADSCIGERRRSTAAARSLRSDAGALQAL
jgi:hypothetical protein